jgi:hypothetical protein
VFTVEKIKNGRKVIHKKASQTRLTPAEVYLCICIHIHIHVHILRVCTYPPQVSIYVYRVYGCICYTYICTGCVLYRYVQNVKRERARARERERERERGRGTERQREDTYVWLPCRARTYRAYTYLSERPRERPAVAGGERRVRVRKGSCQHASFASVSAREKWKRASASELGAGDGLGMLKQLQERHAEV